MEEDPGVRRGLNDGAGIEPGSRFKGGSMIRIQAPDDGFSGGGDGR